MWKKPGAEGPDNQAGAAQEEKKDIPKPEKIFKIGQGPSDTETDQQELYDELDKDKKRKGKRKSKHSHHAHKSHFTESELELRRAKGSELAMEDFDAINKAMGESSDENLDRRDLEDTYHRQGIFFVMLRALTFLFVSVLVDAFM